MITHWYIIAVIHGELKNEDDDLDDHSTPPPPPVDAHNRSRRITEVGTAVSLPPLTIKEKPPINVVGDVGGRIAILVDDLIDDVKPFIDAAVILQGKIGTFVQRLIFTTYYTTIY